MTSPSQWRAALDSLETDLEADPGEKHRLANIVRDEVEAMERGAVAPPAAAPGEKAPPGPAAKRTREIIAWSRGGSFSIRARPEDAEWLQDLYAQVQTAKRHGLVAIFHFMPKDPKKPFDWARGTFGIVDMLDQVEPSPGAWIVSQVVARNLGGYTGLAIMATFGFRSLEPWEP